MSSHLQFIIPVFLRAAFPAFFSHVFVLVAVDRRKGVVIGLFTLTKTRRGRYLLIALTKEVISTFFLN